MDYIDDNYVCMICESRTDLEFLDTEINDKKNCLQMFRYCFNLNFPRKNEQGKLNAMCSECVLHLRECFEFKKQSDLAYQRLLKITQIIKYNDDCKHTPPSIDEFVETPAVVSAKTADVKTEQTYSDYEDWLDNFDQENVEVIKEECLDDKLGENTKDTRVCLEKIKGAGQDITDTREENRIDNFADDDEDGWSDWSTDTVEILTATGFYNQIQIKPTRDPVRPDLEKGTLKCPICGEESLNFNLTYMHYTTHFPAALCHLCGKTTSARSGLRSHMSTHEEKTNEFVCEQCNKVFKTRMILSSHLKYKHKNMRAVTCYHCPMEFSGSLPRMVHMFKVHGVPFQTFQCDKCGKSFYTKGRLKTHNNQVHTKDFNFFCDQCPAAFLFKHQLRDHITYKHGDKSTVPRCELCGKTFTSPKGLRQHMRIHLNIKNYKCTHCDAAFVQKPSLMFHLKKHQKT